MARMSEAFGDSPWHDAVITVDRYGNTASTTHTVALVEELEAGNILPGARRVRHPIHLIWSTKRRPQRRLPPLHPAP
jgi:hypothetical protein